MLLLLSIIGLAAPLTTENLAPTRGNRNDAITDNDGDTYPSDTDCDDTNAAIHPGATELCNSLDDNCDGTIDEDTAQDASTWYADLDLDGYGDPTSTRTTCAQPTGYVADNTDCDDTHNTVSPGATEICDALDNNCDTEVDVNAIDQGVFYADDDGDGYGDPYVSATSCVPFEGYVADNTDCNDVQASIHPGATEIDCNNMDENCDTLDGPCDSTPTGDDSNPETKESTPDGTDPEKDPACGCAGVSVSSSLMGMMGILLARRRYRP